MDLDETLITSCSLRDEPEKILTPAEGGPAVYSNFEIILI